MGRRESVNTCDKRDKLTSCTSWLRVGQRDTSEDILSFS